MAQVKYPYYWSAKYKRVSGWVVYEVSENDPHITSKVEGYYRTRREARSRVKELNND